jgi:phage gp45-like
VISATSGGRWGVEGYSYKSIESNETVTEGSDDEPVDVFQGINMTSRPLAANNAEAILVHVGGASNHPTIVALRDEDARRAYAAKYGNIEAGEIAIFSASARVIVKANGEVHIESDSGAAESLATKADVQAIRDALHSHAHTYIPGSNTPTTTTLNPSVPSPSGTSCLKAQ